MKLFCPRGVSGGSRWKLQCADLQHVHAELSRLNTANWALILLQLKADWTSVVDGRVCLINSITQCNESSGPAGRDLMCVANQRVRVKELWRCFRSECKDERMRAASCVSVEDLFNISCAAPGDPHKSSLPNRTVILSSWSVLNVSLVPDL